MPLSAGTVLSGLGVGLNPVVAPVFKVAPAAALPIWSKTTNNPENEIEALREAIAWVSNHLDELGEKAGGTSAEIFEALKFLMEDDELVDVAIENINDGWSAGAGYGMAVNTFGELLGGDPTFAARVDDLQDLSRRVQARLAGISMGLELPSDGEFVIVGDDFSPADTAQFTKAVVGVITLKGGPTSHTAIICRSRSIPAVVSCSAAAELENGERVLVDPVGDRIVVGGEVSQATAALTFKVTGREPIIPVRSNIGSESDAITASTTAAEGVGLFRTELLYLSAQSQPSIEQQTESYAAVLAAAPAGPIVVRTIDAGSDKPVPFLNMPHEENPSLGVRGYRLIVEHRAFIQDQLKSLELARQKTRREVWVMAPMISTVTEAREFANLARELGEFKVGVMVETPSIAACITDLEGVVDFISVGTNDLSQYLYAADRMNPALGTLLNPWQPGLIRTLANIALGSTAAGVSSGVCGESASDPAFAVVLAGLGFKSVSASPSQVTAVRNALSAVTHEQAREIAAAVLRATTAEEAKALATAMLAAL
jgi:phosphotransferase system enzyme I (PtsI)